MLVLATCAPPVALCLHVCQQRPDDVQQFLQLPRAFQLGLLALGVLVLVEQLQERGLQSRAQGSEHTLCWQPWHVHTYMSAAPAALAMSMYCIALCGSVRGP